MEKRQYLIGEHLIHLQMPYGQTIYLDNYEPFRIESNEKPPVFCATVVEQLPAENGQLIGRFDGDAATIWVYDSGEGCYRFNLSPTGEQIFAIMDTDSSFNKASICLFGNSAMRSFGLNNCLMILYAMSTAPLGTLLLHASVVSYMGFAYLFLGKSGTGKSTHSQLWLNHIEGSELVNDDNPVVRVFSNGHTIMFGSPWSGKTPCYLNRQFPVGALVRLRQAPVNNIAIDRPSKSFASILASCSTIPWDKTIHSAVCDTITHIVEKVNCFKLDCLPDADAALLCMKTVAYE